MGSTLPKASERRFLILRPTTWCSLTSCERRLFSAEKFGCKSEIAAMLEILPRFEELPELSIECLMAFTIRSGLDPCWR